MVLLQVKSQLRGSAGSPVCRGSDCERKRASALFAAHPGSFRTKAAVETTAMLLRLELSSSD
ncbi:hypothetical protein JZ751_001053, partial [Albula glossodonta]